MKQEKRPKIRDVAKLAGVSEAAVSAVMNNRVGQGIRVSEATQAKIHDAIRQLGYIANPAARSLAGGQTNIIAVFTFEPIFPMDHRNFYYPFLIGIEQEAELQGYDLLLITGSEGERRTIYKNGVNRLSLADGAILLGRENKDELNHLLDDEFPFVFVGRRELGRDDLPYVMADYTEASATIVEYLAENGHHNIAYLQSAKDHEPTWDRLDGVVLGLERIGQHPKDIKLWTGQADTLSTHHIQDFFKAGITAFIAEDNLLGERLLQITTGLGLTCPDDFSMAVLGDPLSAFETEYTWTTFKIPRREWGAEAVRLLVQILSDENFAETSSLRKVMTCQFIPGDTVAPLK